MKIKEKIIIFVLVILNILFFEFSNNEPYKKAKAEEMNQKNCESLTDFEKEFVEQLKNEANPDTLENYSSAIKEQINICLQTRLKEQIGEEYEKSIKEDYTFGKDNIRDIIYAKQEYEIRKNELLKDTTKEIELLTKTRLINNSVFSRFMEGLNQVKNLSEKYFAEQKKDATETKAISNSIPSQPNTCI